jgi:hypothetical protein
MAISRYLHGQDLSDSLIGQIGAIRNVKTYTFDKALSKDAAFVVV